MTADLGAASPAASHRQPSRLFHLPPQWGRIEDNMKSTYERRAHAIAALKQGDEPLRFTGRDHNGDEWTAHIHVNEEGAWQVDTMWGGPTIGEVTFHLRREYTKPEYAHDHLHSNNPVSI